MVMLSVSLTPVSLADWRSGSGGGIGAVASMVTVSGAESPDPVPLTGCCLTVTACGPCPGSEVAGDVLHLRPSQSHRIGTGVESVPDAAGRRNAVRRHARRTRR